MDAEAEALGCTWIPVHLRCERPELVKVLEFARRSRRALRSLPEGTLVHAHGYTLTSRHDLNTCHLVHRAWLDSPLHDWRTKKTAGTAYQRLYSIINTRCETSVYRGARLVAAVSSRVQSQLQKAGVPGGKIRVVYNGVDVGEFHPGKENRKELGLPEEVPLAILVGDLRTPKKNVDTLLKALAAVPDLHLAVAGGTNGSPYPELARQLGLETRVRFLGFRRDVAAIMRAADIFANPSRHDSCPLVMFEAMASGLPIVTSCNVGGAEIVDGECGYAIDNPEDDVALAEALGKLSDSARLRQCMGAAARDAALRHTWQAMGAAYCDLYRELAA